jgi:hypothetical protein
VERYVSQSVIATTDARAGCSPLNDPGPQGPFDAEPQSRQNSSGRGISKHLVCLDAIQAELGEPIFDNGDGRIQLETSFRDTARVSHIRLLAGPDIGVRFALTKRSTIKRATPFPRVCSPACVEARRGCP